MTDPAGDLTDDFAHNTRFIRRWINHQSVVTTSLAEQLDYWARWAEAGADLQTPKQRVWKVLVTYAGANAEQWDEFNHHWPECGEFRFMGVFGFGGKIRAPDASHPHPYVTTDPQADTWLVQYLIKAINTILERT
jgi:hypothetical protein